MARVNANKQYIFKETINGIEYKIYCYASDNSSNISSPTPVVLNDCIESLKLDSEYQNFPFGLKSSPVLELEINVNRTGTDFNNILKDPFRDYSCVMPLGGNYITGAVAESKTISAGNIWEVYSGSTLVFLGLQKSAVGSQYDVDKKTLKVEIWHISRIIAENLDMSLLNQLVYLKNYILKEDNCTIDVLYQSTIFSPAPVDTFALISNPPRGFYYYFMPFNRIWTELNRFYNAIISKITRTLHSESAGIPFPDNLNLYEQDLSVGLGRGASHTVSDSTVYVLSFVTNKTLANRLDSDFIIGDSFVNYLEQYKTFWEYFTAYSKQLFNRVSYKAKGFQSGLLFNSNPVTLDVRNKGTIELDYNQLSHSEVASVSKIDNEVDRLELSFQGARSENTGNLTILYNQSVTSRNITGTNVVFYTGQNLINYFVDASFSDYGRVYILRHLKPDFLCFYYFQNPYTDDYIFTKERFIKFNHNVEILFGDSISSDEFTPLLSLNPIANVNAGNYWRALLGALYDLNVRGGGLYAYSKSFLELFRGIDYQQAKVEVETNNMSNLLDVLKNNDDYNLSIDISGTLPENDLTFFDNITDEYYILKQEINFNAFKSENNKISVKYTLMSRSYA